MPHSPILFPSVPKQLPFFGWDWLYNSAHWGECFDFWGRLDQIKWNRPRPRERVALCHLLIRVSIVTYSSLPFLFSPLPFVCLLRLLSIWPAIDKTQSLTMIGTRCKIGGNGPHTLWWICVCLGFGIEMVCSSRHCLSTFPLPDGTQQKEFASWQPQSFLPLSFLHPSIPPALLWFTLDCGPGFRSRTCSVRLYKQSQEGRLRIERKPLKVRWYFQMCGQTLDLRTCALRFYLWEIKKNKHWAFYNSGYNF